MDTAIVAQAAQYSNYLNAGTLVGLLGNRSPTKQPTGDVFPTSDGYIQVTALRDPQVKALFEIMGVPEKLDEEPFDSARARLANPDIVKEFVAAELRKNTTRWWMEHLAPAGVPVAEVRTLPEVVEDEQLKLRGVFETLPSPLDPDKEITVIKAGFVTDADGPAVRSGPPRLGEHTALLLTELGYADADIEAMRSEGIIG